MYHAIFGVVLLIIAFLWFFFPPKSRAKKYGYRSIRAMKSEDAFEFANKLASEYFLAVAFGTVIISMAGNFFSNPRSSLMATIFAFVLFLILFILFVENQLKTNFDENGKR